MGGFALAGLGNAMRWLRGNWQDWPDYLLFGLLGLGAAVVAPGT